MIIWSVLSLLGLLAVSAFFSAIETAFTSLNPGQVNALAESKGRRGQLIKRFTQRPATLLTTLLIGNNVANLGASALSTALTIRLLGNAYIAATTGFLTLLVLTFCEVTPKQLAMVKNEIFCLRSVRLILLLSWIFYPIIRLVTAISRSLTRLISGREKPEMTMENLLLHIKAAENEGLVESFEEEMVRNIFRINDTPVEAIMTHRTKLFTLEETMTASEALPLFLHSGYSRAPVLERGSEYVCGILGLHKIADVARKNPNVSIKEILSPAILVPGTLKAHELFFRLKKENIPMAIVLDEYGGLDGVVTREDVVAEIFEEFHDSHQEEGKKPLRPELGTGAWIIRGDADFYDISDYLGLNLAHDSRTHTIGGYLMEKLEEIPSKGTRIDLPEGRYEIMEIQKKRITRLRFTPVLKNKDR